MITYIADTAHYNEVRLLHAKAPGPISVPISTAILHCGAIGSANDMPSMNCNQSETMTALIGTWDASGIKNDPKCKGLLPKDAICW